MAVVLGLPLCGACFIPLAIVALTILFYCTYFVSRHKENNSVVPEKIIEPSNSAKDSETSVSVKDKPKRVKKSCNKKNGTCCSSKKKGVGACSSKDGSISITKVFLVGYTERFIEFGEIISKRLSDENLAYELIHISDVNAEVTLKNETGGSSLCAFVVDSNLANGPLAWLQQSADHTREGNCQLSGMKYAVFTFVADQKGSHGSVTVDQMLHKLGAVRVCKAASADLEDAMVSIHFQEWTTQLSDRIHKWNAPGGKACKCGPKDNKGYSDGGGSCSGSSDCSSSNEDEGKEDDTRSSLLDLEDIGRTLNR